MGLAFWSALIAASASAADSPATPDDSPGSGALETIVVTAERRVDSVQRTPISIEAFDTKRLQDLGIESVSDLSSQVPAMTVQPFPTNNSQLVIFIRGIGVVDAQVTQDPSVGIYIDGIYIARSAGLALDIADLARIEVLRGPQGTLYGRNATGGAVNLITRKPSLNELSGNASIGYGSRNDLKAKATLNLPLGSDAAMKLSVLDALHDGFVRNTGAGGQFGYTHDGGLRFDTSWIPLDWLSVDYAFDLSDLPHYNYSYQAILPPAHSHGQSDLIAAYAESQTVYAPHRLSALATGAELAESKTHVRGHALTLSAESDAFEVKYIGSFRTIRDAFYSDLGGGAGSLGYRLDTQTYDGPSAMMANGGPTPLQIPTLFQHQWSQEIEFGGKLLDNTLDFVSGAYYFSEDGGENGQPLHHVLNGVINPSSDPSLPAQLPSLASALINLTGPQLVEYWKYLYEIHNTATALYGQATWSPEWADRMLHITAGARQSWDLRRAVKSYVADEYVEGQQNNVPAAIQLPNMQGNDTFDNVQASKRFSDFSTSFNIQYEFALGSAAYLSSAKAYKSGGFNVRDPQISSASGPASNGVNYGVGFIDGFKPEHVHSYELGVKSEWLQRRLRINADVFDTGYRDEQINFIIPGTVGDTKTLNAGRARIQGFELDTTWLLAPSLTASLNYSLLYAKTLEVIDINGNNVASQYPFPSAPRDSGNASLEWICVQRDWGKLRAFVSGSYLGKQLGSSSLPTFPQGSNISGYALVSAQFGLAGLNLCGDNRIDLNIWGHNLLNQEYVTSAITNLPQADRAVLWGEPRSLGLNLVYKYK